ncbi:hypothetical protein GOP47_0011850, partial [Adiantum capillus-veneris]
EKERRDMGKISKVAVVAVLVVVVMAMVVAADEYGGQGQGCDTVVAEVKDLCKDYVVGKEPPSPGLSSPCCKSLRRNRGALKCLCGRVDFSSLNKRNLLLTSTICLIGPLECA